MNKSFVLPASSVATELTVVIPSLNSLPEAGVLTIVGLPVQLSVAFTEKFTLAAQMPGLFATVLLAGQSILGSSSSTTSIWNLQMERLPALSIAKEITEVTPIGKSLPEAGLVLNLGLGSTIISYFDIKIYFSQYIVQHQF